MTPTELFTQIGREVGTSGWITISQAMIDRFADATLDHQFIHVDAERAAKTPFGNTIAHGFLTLSLLTRMSEEALPPIENTGMTLNYGMNRIRFLSPVASGKQVRGRFALQSAEWRGEGRLLLTHDVTVEIDGEPKPALIAEWLTLAIVAPPTD